MKRNTIIIILAFMVLVSPLLIESCVSTKIANKSGTELWSENCQRCHNAPPISAFTSMQWEVINTHMKQRAMLTDVEYKKVLNFLQARD